MGGDTQLDFNIYGYVPSLAAGGVFVAIFSLLTILHTGLTLRSRTQAWVIFTAVGGIGEIIGWAGRIMSGQNVYSMNAFLVQQCCLVIAPVFFSAVTYGLFGAIIPRIDAAASPLRPKAYAAIFITIDVITLAIQGAGGAMAGIALGNGDESYTGTHIMLAGIVCQLVTMLVFSSLVAVFAWRTRTHPSLTSGDVSARHRRIVLTGAMGATFFLVIRGIYRTVELAEGWQGYLITHQGYFIALDALMSTLAMVSLAVAHPGIFSAAFVDDEATPATTPLKQDEKSGSFASESTMASV